MKTNLLSFWDKNPRSITDANLEKLKISLQKDPAFLERRTILVNHTNGKYIVYAWNQRLKWLIALWYEEIPDKWITIDKDLPEVVMEERAIKDNTEYGTWDNDLLVENFTKEQIESMDLPVEEINIEIFDVEPDLDEENQDGAPLPNKEAIIVKIWDIFQLGNHRVMCGDSTIIENAENLMGGGLADMYLSEPPYNVDYEWKTKDALKIQNDNKSDDEFLQFLTDAFGAVNSVLKEWWVFYIWHADSEWYNFRYACKLSNRKIRECLIWNKSSMVLWRQDYQRKHEPCLYWWKDWASHYWGNDRSQTTVLEFQKPTSSKLHPTMKPIELLEYQIWNSSKKGEIILDTFLWSGSTLIACEKTGRICYGIELDPIYVEVILKRYYDYTKWAKEIKCINRDIDLSGVLQDNNE